MVVELQNYFERRCVTEADCRKIVPQLLNDGH
jgi:hypothetical protein